MAITNIRQNKLYNKNITSGKKGCFKTVIKWSTHEEVVIILYTLQQSPETREAKPDKIEGRNTRLNNNGWRRRYPHSNTPSSFLNNRWDLADNQQGNRRFK